MQNAYGMVVYNILENALEKLELFSKYCSHLAGGFRRCGFQPRI